MPLRKLLQTSWYVTYILKLLNRDSHDDSTSSHRPGEDRESDPEKKELNIGSLLLIYLVINSIISGY